SSAEALPIKLTGFERVRGGNTRITFRAGEEAVADYRAKHEAASALVRAFSAPVGSWPGAERSCRKSWPVASTKPRVGVAALLVPTSSGSRPRPPAAW